MWKGVFLDKWIYTCKRIKLNSKWIIDLNLRFKIIKCLGENIEVSKKREDDTQTEHTYIKTNGFKNEEELYNLANNGELLQVAEEEEKYDPFESNKGKFKTESGRNIYYY